MEQDNLEITKEFDNKFSDIEKMDEGKKKIIVSVLYTVAIILFIFVLIGTVLSIKNYVDAKNKHDNQNNVPAVTFKKVS